MAIKNMSIANLYCYLHKYNFPSKSKEKYDIFVYLPSLYFINFKTWSLNLELVPNVPDRMIVEKKGGRLDPNQIIRDQLA